MRPRGSYDRNEELLTVLGMYGIVSLLSVLIPSIFVGLTVYFICWLFEPQIVTIYNHIVNFIK
jgi:hypothetical protein